MKRIAVYLDGTWSGPSTDTNVRRLFDLTLDDHGTQRAVYFDGVGMVPGHILGGGLLGVGLGDKVREAYRWLVQNYEDGDQIFIFGFSRGAYTARSLAGMVARCGLLRDLGSMNEADVYDRYRKGNDVDRLADLQARQRRGDDRFSPEERRLLAHSRVVEIEFIGVWDTVGALGVPFGRIQGLSRVTLFHDTNPSLLYRNMFHALAIDEQRKAFQPTLWTESQKPGGFRLDRTRQQLEQCWFAGSHSNVGGGEGDHGLSMVTLEWMYLKAKECGLVFTREVKADQDQVNGPVLDSYGTFLGGTYRLISGRYERPIGAGVTDGELPINETIEGAAFDRTRAVPGYRPPNLLAWARRHALILANLHGTTPAT